MLPAGRRRGLIAAILRLQLFKLLLLATTEPASLQAMLEVRLSRVLGIIRVYSKVLSGNKQTHSTTRREHTGTSHQCSRITTQVLVHVRFGSVFIVPRHAGSCSSLYEAKPPPVPQCAARICCVEQNRRMQQFNSTCATPPALQGS